MTHIAHSRSAGRRSGSRTLASLSFLVAVLLVWPAIPGSAHAQAPPQAQAPAQVVEPTESKAVRDDKSPALALALPLASIGAGVWMISRTDETQALPLFVTGILVTGLVAPSVGHLYVGDNKRALIQMGVRAGAFAMIVLGAQWIYEQEECWAHHPEANGRCAPDSGDLLMLGGFAVGAVSTVYSLVDAPFAAHRHNVRARRRQLLLTPAPVVGPDHATGLGLHLSGRF